MALAAEHPLLTRAIATRKGALPNPATQCTPILLSFLFFGPELIESVSLVPPPAAGG